MVVINEDSDIRSDYLINASKNAMTPFVGGGVINCRCCRTLLFSLFCDVLVVVEKLIPVVTESSSISISVGSLCVMKSTICCGVASF